VVAPFGYAFGRSHDSLLARTAENRERPARF
jgi:hypothetical protein